MNRPLAIAIGLALVVLPGVAAAKPRVAFVPIDGDPGGEIQDVIGEALESELVVVGPKEVTRTEDKLGFEGELSDKQLKKLANELEADAVVQGSLTAKGSNRLLHFKLFVHGKKVKGFKIEFASAKSLKFKQALHDKLIEKLGGDAGDDRPRKKKGDGDAGDDEDPIGGKKIVKKKGGDDDKPVKKKGDDDDKPVKKKAGDDAEDDHPRKKKKTAHKDEDDAGKEDEEGEVAVTVSPHSANRDAVRVDLGLSVMTRSLAFTSRAFEQAPKGYTNSPVPGARFEAELYPFAFGNPNSPAAGLGFAGEFDQTLALSLQSTAQPGTKFPVTERHYSIGLRYRIAFGSRPTSPSATFGVGYGERMFVVNRSALNAGNVIDLPDVDYVGYDPGLEFRIPLGTAVALRFGGRAIFVTSAGPIGNLDQYGQAKVTGGQGMAGLDIMLGGHYAIRVVGEVAQMGYAFTGNGMMANARDGDPTTKDVGGAADRYIGGAATFAVLY